jgi:hypothetical protein
MKRMPITPSQFEVLNLSQDDIQYVTKRYIDNKEKLFKDKEDIQSHLSYVNSMLDGSINGMNITMLLGSDHVSIEFSFATYDIIFTIYIQTTPCFC